MTRRLVECFALENPVYADALVTFKQIDVRGHETGKLIDLWSDIEGGSKLPNPQRLSRRGALRQATYYEGRHRPVVETAKVARGGNLGIFESIGADDSDDDNGQFAWLFPGDVGLVGNAQLVGGAIQGIDDSGALNAAINTWSPKGGKVIWCVAQPERAIRIDKPVLVKSGMTLAFLSPILFGPLGCIRIAGQVAEAATVATLSADATASSSTLAIDVSSVGVTLLSQAYAAGDRLVLRGERDGVGNSVERQEVKVTAVDDTDSELTVTPVLGYAFKKTYQAGAYEAVFGIPNVTQIYKQTQATVAADVAVGDRAITAGIGIENIPEGAWCLLEDDVTADYTGSGTADLIHREVVQVIEVSGDQVTLDRAVEHVFVSASGARLTLLDPAKNAHVQNAEAEFHTEATSTVTHPFEFRYAVDSTFEGIKVKNEGLFGSRGNVVRFTYAYNCGVRDLDARNPKYLAAGEGYCLGVYWSTECWMERINSDGCRHMVVFKGATKNRLSGFKSKRSIGEHVDFHGAEEVANSVHDGIAEGGPALVGFGDEEMLAGGHRNTVSDVTYRGTSTSEAVKILAPSSQNIVRGLKVEGSRRIVGARSAEGHPELVASNNVVELVRGKNISDRIIEVKGDNFDEDAVGVTKLIISDWEVDDATKGAYLADADDCEIDDIKLRSHGDASDKYSVRATDCTRLTVTGSRFSQGIRGISLTDCVDAMVFDNRFVRQSEGTVFLDGGGNTDSGSGIRTWDQNTYHGFTPSGVPSW